MNVIVANNATRMIMFPSLSWSQLAKCRLRMNKTVRHPWRATPCRIVGPYPRIRLDRAGMRRPRPARAKRRPRSSTAHPHPSSIVEHVHERQLRGW